MPRIQPCTGCTTPDDTILGHLGLSSISYHDDQQVSLFLAPLAVDPTQRGQELGSDLVKHAISHAMGSHQPRILVYGDPSFYGRFGFDRQPAITFKLLFPLTQPIDWQGIIAQGKEPQHPIAVQCHPALMHAQIW
ncbi:MAG: GNAT family N-acetyltransferase [Synechococcus sp.]